LTSSAPACRFGAGPFIVLVKGRPFFGRGALMAQYLILIYNNEAEFNALEPAASERLRQAHVSFGQANGPHLRGGARLADSDAATSIRTDAGGAQTVADGMFPETKEVLAGFYLIEADDLDAAIAIGRQVPSTGGGIEVRPVVPS
jgi:hypothetical protein